MCGYHLTHELMVIKTSNPLECEEGHTSKYTMALINKHSVSACMHAWDVSFLIVKLQAKIAWFQFWQMDPLEITIVVY